MQINTEKDLNDWLTAWANYHVMLAMSQLGLFDLLADGLERTAYASQNSLTSTHAQ